MARFGIQRRAADDPLGRIDCSSVGSGSEAVAVVVADKLTVDRTLARVAAAGVD